MMSKTARVISTPPLTPIPPLSLTPESHPIQQSNPEIIDKFASLFSPATPPATPTSSPRLHPSRYGPRSPPLAHRSEVPSSPNSDFGSFVSVAPAHDPLSLSSAPSSPSTSFMLSSVAILKPHIQNASMRFFDQFTEEARHASERKKKGYLDELLLHEDDPLYWLKEDTSISTNDNGRDDNGSADTTEGDKKGEHNELPISIHPENTERPLIDLSSDDFGDNDANSPENVESIDDDKRDTQPLVAEGLVFSPVRVPSPSPSLPALPLAPSSRPPPRPSSALSHTPPPRSESPSSLSTPPRPNYNTLSTFSSRWMSSLISSSRISAPSTSPTTHQTLDTLFATNPSPTPATHSHRHATHPTTPAAHPSHAPTKTGTVPIPRPQHARNVTSSLASISHGTPFASHLSYFPPSGAPGFSGDDHSWDRGFSQDFDKEQVKRRNVLLKDRREGEGCVGVLDVELADLIRPHLPALARLPHAWTLLYSLDQHGISLNTLYTRCENQRSKVGIGGISRGALIVIKDSGDSLFGAWIGEGIRLSKGAYYGSGEAFLWKYTSGQPEVYKWTGKNDYVALCEPEFISFGGGEGQYGLYIDRTLSEGSSARCPTFENEPLCSLGPKMGGASTFECVGLEVWAVGM